MDSITNARGLQGTAAASPDYVVNLPAPTGTGSGGALGMTLGSIAGTLNINLRLSSLEQTGNVRIVSAPKIMTLDNVEASIEQGVAIPISVVSAAGTNTVFVDAKLNLTVKPHVTNEGSVIMGLGSALYEAVDFADGQVTNANLSDYQIPSFLDVPALSHELLERDGADVHGLGETALPVIPAAVGNALRSLGLPVSHMPVHAEDVLQAVDRREGRGPC